MLAKILQDPSFTLPTVRGAAVRVQASIVLLPAFGAAAGLVSGGASSALFMLALVIALYLCASLHEVGHIIPARACGRSVTRVRFSGIGAFVRMESDSATRPYQELVIALGGPLASGLLTVALGFAAWPAFTTRGLAVFVARDGAGLLAALAATNALLTVFNLLPVFPLDGGRALNAVLAIYMRPAQATHMVSIFGQLMAVALIGVGFIASGDIVVRGLSAGLAATIFRVSQRTERASRQEQQGA